MRTEQEIKDAIKDLEKKISTFEALPASTLKELAYLTRMKHKLSALKWVINEERQA